MSNIVAADELLLLIERVERLEEEKKGIADDIRDVYSEAKSRGYDTKTMRAIVRLRKMDEHERREAEAMLDTYKAALGMLDGTPLGKWAIERLNPKPANPPPGDAGNDDAPDSALPPEEPPAPPPPPAPELTVEDAQRMGTDAARAGEKVTRNPFPAYDERRAAWDEAWCKALGSDGMEIPEALRPSAKPQKPKQVPPSDEEQKDVLDANKPLPDLTEAARTLIIGSQKASTSQIQRLLKIGYNAAAKIIETLEFEGVISAADGNGKREVLIDREGRKK